MGCQTKIPQMQWRRPTSAIPAFQRSGSIFEVSRGTDIRKRRRMSEKCLNVNSSGLNWARCFSTVYKILDVQSPSPLLLLCLLTYSHFVTLKHPYPISLSRNLHLPGCRSEEVRCFSLREVSNSERSLLTRKSIVKVLTELTREFSPLWLRIIGFSETNL